MAQGEFRPRPGGDDGHRPGRDRHLQAELTGVYVRNGSNPLRGASPHWFLGDGMVHGVRLEAGTATWYRNRWVRTGLYDHGGGLGAGRARRTATLSNVSVVHLGGRPGPGRVGVPYALDPADLSTLGPWPPTAARTAT